MNKTLKKKRWLQNQRHHMIKQWLMSFVVTTVVIVAAVILPQEDPKAQFDRIGTLNQTIYYSITVSDPHHTLDPESLKLRVESQFETMEFPLEIGINSDSISLVREHTRYYLKIVGTRGFGDEVFASKTVDTDTVTGGAITDITLLTTDLSMHELEYAVETKVANPSGIYTELYFKYASVYPNSGIDFTDLSSLTFDSILLSSDDMIHTVLVSNFNPTLIGLIEGITPSGEHVILDQWIWQAPIRFEGSVYPIDASAHFLLASVYLSDIGIPDITYELRVYDHQKHITTIEVFPMDDSTHHDEPITKITGLEANTEYHLELWALYKDAITFEPVAELISSVSAMTTPPFELSTQWVDEITSYHAQLDIEDPNHVFQTFYVLIYDTSGEWDLLVSWDEVIVTRDSNGTISVSIDIAKPALPHYRIVIAADKILPNTTIYYDTELITINDDE